MPTLHPSDLQLPGQRTFPLPFLFAFKTISATRSRGISWLEGLCLTPHQRLFTAPIIQGSLSCTRRAGPPRRMAPFLESQVESTCPDRRDPTLSSHSTRRI